MDASLPVDDGTYRAYRFPWSATPKTLAGGRRAATGSTAVSVFASWNGATEVASWQVLAGPSAGSLSRVATARPSDFETTVDVSSSADVLRGARPRLEGARDRPLGGRTRVLSRMGKAEELEPAGAYWPRPWSCEDGGPRRWGAVAGQPGLGIQPGERLEVAAVHDAFATDALVRREPGELYALRHAVPLGGPQAGDCEAWVERLDPATLAVTASTPRLPGGRFWPGGIAAHACGDLHAVYGRWAHRLSPELDVLASHRLPIDRPYNSFVVLDGGELVTKDCDAPAGREPSTVSVLDPISLLPVAPPLPLPEPSVGRLSSDGEIVYAIGTTAMFALRLDRDAGRLVLDEHWRPSYGPAPGRSYGWDPVVTGEHVFWMDNGRNSVDHTMLGSGRESSPLRLWWARVDDGSVRSVEISGLPYGTESNPAGLGPGGRHRGRLRRGQRRRARLAPGGRRARAALAAGRPRARRPPDPLRGHARAGRGGLARSGSAQAGRAPPPGCRDRADLRAERRVQAGQPVGSEAIRWSSSIWTRAKRRPASRFPPRSRASSSRLPVQVETSTTSRSPPLLACE